MNRNCPWVATLYNMIYLMCLSAILVSCQSGNGDAEFNDFDIDVSNLPGLEEEEDAREEHLRSDRFLIWWEEVDVPTPFLYETLNERFEKINFYYHFNYIPPFSKGLSDGTHSNLFERMVSDRNIPDLIFFNRHTFPILLEADFLEPVEFESLLNLDASILDTTRLYAPDLQLYALPFGEIRTGLFYNKEIFDEMNVQYPTDGMTWEEVTVLAHQLVNPEKWASLVIDDLGIVASQIDIREPDFDSHQLDYSSEPWPRMVDFVKSLKGTGNSSSRSQYPFASGEAAMFAGTVFSTGLIGPFQEPMIMNWDMVTYPVFDDGHAYAPGREIVYVGIPRKSKQKEIVYEVIRYLFSKEVQTEYMRQGLFSLRTDIDAELFGEGTILRDKSIASLIHPNETGPFDPSVVLYHGLNRLHSTAHRWYSTPLSASDDFEKYIEHTKLSLQEELKNYTESRDFMLTSLGK